MVLDSSYNYIVGTSNRPQNGIGKHLGPNSMQRLSWVSCGESRWISEQQQCANSCCLVLLVAIPVSMSTVPTRGAARCGGLVAFGPLSACFEPSGA